MGCARLNRRRAPAGTTIQRRHPGLGLPLLALAAAAWVVPARAQTTDFAPNILPPAPQGGFGLPSPFAPPNAIYGGPPLPGSALPPADTLGLSPVLGGVTPLQAYDPNAPAILVQPYLTVGTRFTDNANFSHSNRQAAIGAFGAPGISISADTPRLQAVLSGQTQASLYTTSTLNQVNSNLYMNGVGTVVPDLLFVDARSVLTQASLAPGLGFINPAQLPRNQQTQVYSNTVSPYLRESFGGFVDTELRYRFGSTNFGGNTGVVSVSPAAAINPAALAAQTNLASGIFNEGTFTAASGRDFERALSRLTVDASRFNSASTNRNTQFSAFNDFEYRITPEVAALGRVGYQNIEYPFSPAASFEGATWLIGGRLGLAADYGYVSLEYGRQQGVYGFTGSALYQITPTIVATATLVQGVSSPTQYFQNALGSSSLDPYGAIVDQYSGLPTAFYNPGLGFTNNVYRQHLLNFGISDSIGPNRYSLYGYYNTQTSLTPPITAPTKSLGASFTWSRDIRPDLNGSASVGYANSRSVPTIASTTPIGSLNTLSANLGLNYLISSALTGSVLYSFSLQTNGQNVGSGRTGDIYVNSLQLLLTKTF